MIGKLACGLLTLGTLLTAQAAPDAGLQRGLETFRDAYQEWSASGFRDAAGELRRAASRQPQSATPHYWLGVAHFHRMLQFDSRPSAPRWTRAAAAERELAIEALEEAVDLDPGHAEAHAILATLYGMKIDGSLLRALRYGRRVHHHHGRAIEHGAKNPRVQYLVGAGLFHTAADEHDLLEALKALLLAEALYLAEAQHPRPTADWGHDACLAFIGRTFVRLKKPQKARGYFRKALRIRPSNHMAQAGLQQSESH